MEVQGSLFMQLYEWWEGFIFLFYQVAFRIQLEAMLLKLFEYFPFLEFGVEFCMQLVHFLKAIEFN